MLKDMALMGAIHESSFMMMKGGVQGTLLPGEQLLGIELGGGRDLSELGTWKAGRSKPTVGPLYVFSRRPKAHEVEQPEVHLGQAGTGIQDKQADQAHNNGQGQARSTRDGHRTSALGRTNRRPRGAYARDDPIIVEQANRKKTTYS
ncbi:hypothetical protein E2562_006871 [Oryza meyeriana var. granulata]|uniref:Uncharacterized protein n=1 Tax=Oryza meyeriana var. granulata TaxID=110450 RepID=A0A6G1C4R3_9ORYZ|nr:hypothetical protein E2562_006871 [Oryza meyeriana var. granulata]